MLISVHTICCYWISISYREVERNTWIVRYNYENDSSSNIYCNSYYFIMATVLSIGYGDITPKTTLETLFITLILIIGALLYSIILSNFSEIFKKTNEKEEIFRRKYQIYKEIESEFKIIKKNEKLDLGIKLFLIHNYRNYNKDIIGLIDSLPGTCKNHIYLKMYESKIKSLMFFKEQSIDFILFVVPMLKSNIYEKKQVIVSVGQNIDEIYFIDKGQVNITLGAEFQDYVIAKLKSPYHWGDFNMFSDETSSYDIVVVIKNTEILTLSKKDFGQVRLNFSIAINEVLERSFRTFYKIEQRKKRALNYYNIHNTFDGFASQETIAININIEKMLNMWSEKDYLSRMITLEPGSPETKQSYKKQDIQKLINENNILYLKTLVTKNNSINNSKNISNIDSNSTLKIINSKFDSPKGKSLLRSVNSIKQSSIRSKLIKLYSMEIDDNSNLDSLKNSKLLNSSKSSSNQDNKLNYLTDYKRKKSKNSSNGSSKNIFINYIRKSLKNYKEDTSNIYPKIIHSSLDITHNKNMNNSNKKSIYIKSYSSIKKRKYLMQSLKSQQLTTRTTNKRRSFHYSTEKFKSNYDFKLELKPKEITKEKFELEKIQNIQTNLLHLKEMNMKLSNMAKYKIIKVDSRLKENNNTFLKKSYSKLPSLSSNLLRVNDINTDKKKVSSFHNLRLIGTNLNSDEKPSLSKESNKEFTGKKTLKDSKFKQNQLINSFNIFTSPLINNVKKSCVSDKTDSLFKLKCSPSIDTKNTINPQSKDKNQNFLSKIKNKLDEHALFETNNTAAENIVKMLIETKKQEHQFTYKSFDSLNDEN